MCEISGCVGERQDALEGKLGSHEDEGGECGGTAEAGLEVRIGNEETSGKESMQGIVCSVRDVRFECFL